ncbi:MAG: bifunctional phosphopantothenoylcysteine decarboxylase/phosphopantothenate--cysteine ligase CoaBC [Clostridiaceae bacterium]|nr:bifunctional phosphopantothenoylcysteine decarboxylase/phosphopantothenate--cysteine ligase CoaBC [Clostridiaceae bacterium]
MKAKKATIVIGISGSIAAYKTCSLVSKLVKEDYDVYVVMTPTATKFVHPATFEALTGHSVLVDVFDRSRDGHDGRVEIEHIAMAKRADVFLLAPGSANTIAKLALGLADNMLTDSALAMSCPRLIAPGMNTVMYQQANTQRNLETLRRDGWRIIEPGSGYLACGDIGTGKMAEPEQLYTELIYSLTEKDLVGRKILVTAGPTREPIDPVRYITNHSSGKMGLAVAFAAACRGAEVTLIMGPSDLYIPPHMKLIPVTTAAEMFSACQTEYADHDIIVMAAAVADFTPAHTAEQKLKKHDTDLLELSLAPTRDILKWLGEHRRPGQVLCGFAMETENLLENARAKLESKNCDLIAANSLTEPGSGFGVDTNRLTILTDGGVGTLPLMSKDEAANRLLDIAADLTPRE